jgi:hypothetical protein
LGVGTFRPFTLRYLVVPLGGFSIDSVQPLKATTLGVLLCWQSGEGRDTRSDASRFDSDEMSPLYESGPGRG